MGELVIRLNNFYASIVSAKVLPRGNEKLDDKGGKATGKRSRKRKGGEGKGKTPKKPKEVATKVVVPGS